MAKLSAFTDNEQLPFDDVLAEFRGDSPPEGASVITAGIERSDSQAKKGTETHDGDCPNSQQCESERQQRPYYLPSTCHWRAFGDWRRCKKLKGGMR